MKLPRFTLALAAVAALALVVSAPPVRALVENQAFGVFGVTPVTTQPAAAAQAAVTQTGATNATATPTDTASLITSVNALKVQGNASQVDIAALTAHVNAIRTALVNLGLIKGGP